MNPRPAILLIAMVIQAASLAFAMNPENATNSTSDTNAAREKKISREPPEEIGRLFSETDLDKHHNVRIAQASDSAEVTTTKANDVSEARVTDETQGKSTTSAIEKVATDMAADPASTEPGNTKDPGVTEGTRATSTTEASEAETSDPVTDPASTEPGDSSDPGVTESKRATLATEVSSTVTPNPVADSAYTEPGDANDRGVAEGSRPTSTSEASETGTPNTVADSVSTEPGDYSNRGVTEGTRATLATEVPSTGALNDTVADSASTKTGNANDGEVTEGTAATSPTEASETVASDPPTDNTSTEPGDANDPIVDEGTRATLATEISETGTSGTVADSASTGIGNTNDAAVTEDTHVTAVTEASETEVTGTATDRGSMPTSLPPRNPTVTSQRVENEGATATTEMGMTTTAVGSTEEQRRAQIEEESKTRNAESNERPGRPVITRGHRINVAAITQEAKTAETPSSSQTTGIEARTSPEIDSVTTPLNFSFGTPSTVRPGAEPESASTATPASSEAEELQASTSTASVSTVSAAIPAIGNNFGKLEVEGTEARETTMEVGKKTEPEIIGTIEREQRQENSVQELTETTTIATQASPDPNLNHSQTTQDTQPTSSGDSLGSSIDKTNQPRSGDELHNNTWVTESVKVTHSDISSTPESTTNFVADSAATTAETILTSTKHHRTPIDEESVTPQLATQLHSISHNVPIQIPSGLESGMNLTDSDNSTVHNDTAGFPIDENLEGLLGAFTKPSNDSAAEGSSKSSTAGSSTVATSMESAQGLTGTISSKTNISFSDAHFTTAPAVFSDSTTASHDRLVTGTAASTAGKATKLIITPSSGIKISRGSKTATVTGGDGKEDTGGTEPGTPKPQKITITRTSGTNQRSVPTITRGGRSRVLISRGSATSDDKRRPTISRSGTRNVDNLTVQEAPKVKPVIVRSGRSGENLSISASTGKKQTVKTGLIIKKTGNTATSGQTVKINGRPTVKTIDLAEKNGESGGLTIRNSKGSVSKDTRNEASRDFDRRDTYPSRTGIPADRQ